MIEPVVQVVLDPGLREGEVTLGEVVDVQEIVSTEKIVCGFEELGPVESSVETTVDSQPALCPPFCGKCEVEVVLVCPAGLLDVLGTAVG